MVVRLSVFSLSALALSSLVPLDILAQTSVSHSRCLEGNVLQYGDSLHWLRQLSLLFNHSLFFLHEVNSSQLTSPCVFLSCKMNLHSCSLATHRVPF